MFHNSFTQNRSASRPRVRRTRLIRCSELALVGSCCTVNHTARGARLTRPPWGEVDTKESTPTCVCIPGGRTPERKVRRWKNSQWFNLEDGLTQEVERSRDQLDPVCGATALAGMGPQARHPSLRPAQRQGRAYT